MTRLYGRAPRGERVVGTVPQNYGANVTMLAALGSHGVEAVMTIDYDATHGFSDQYLVELDVFLACAREAGLVADERFQATFPPADLATISINFFTSSA
jgi:hypothetical protein